jgi:uncharacterized phage-like protein YoqJ
MIIAGTGHRPPKLGGYDEKTFQRLVQFAEIQLEGLSPSTVVSGMALGWDQALAHACITIGIPFVAAVPCPGHSDPWPDYSKKRYDYILGHAKSIITVSDRYSSVVMQRRNIVMVDMADEILALWNGTGGGTANCIAYARQQKKPIINVWDEYIQFKPN